ncbi:hypothetical protein HYU22_04345 [Candidatus Woesearchaeota archaeon]|nr:hypothetical protein [Candidatus Woesearchaeota archaeon]
MPFGTIEILAAILIAVSIIKLLVLSFSPKSWLGLARQLYLNSTITSVVALLLAAVVFYFLRKAGITVLEIFAVMLFLSLLMMMSMAKYAETLIDIYAKKGTINIWKEHWLEMVVWIILLIFGIKELFF